jgi:HD-GYP domain-containing protein (c-di-GMP phosphodiesterase class II)
MFGETLSNLQRILDTTLASFLDLVRCDAGSVFTVRKNAAGEQVLKFEAMITRSLDLRGVPKHLENLTFGIDDSSIVGRTAADRKAILLDLDSEQARRSLHVSELLHYETRNIFSGPLITPRGGLVGVVQLLNKLPPDGTRFDSRDTSAPPPFDENDERLFSIIVGQSALAIENSLLLEEQEHLIQGFVNACVTAIEARDPVTSGHSMRVATYTVGLAEAVSRTETGPLKEILFTAPQLRELRFASMLHDIGKIGVREEILQKRQKLHPHELELISMRMRLMRAHMMSGEDTHRHELEQLDDAWNQVLQVNEPPVVDTPTLSAIERLRSLQVRIGPDQVLAAITDEEFEKLSVMKGSLSEAERIEIEGHVQKTFEILKHIPWSRGLEMVPLIASMHHENLDGSGYPAQIRAEGIPAQARMMAICDIYDALRAADRPYKPALSAERALDILAAHVKAGKLDGDYFDVFVESQVYRLSPKSDLTTTKVPEFCSTASGVLV